MAATQVDICNIALGYVGISERIEAITDDVPEADACELHYDTVLDKALGKFDWAFARRLLTLSTFAGTPPSPWAYQYVWPTLATMVKPLYIDDELTVRESRERIPFKRYQDGSGNSILLTMKDSAKLWYTYRETDVSKWPEWFVQFMAWSLAEKIAGPLTSEEDIQKMAKERAIVEMAEAISQESETEQEYPEPEASWIRARDSDVRTMPGTRADLFDFF
jgi:hypothetical protein